MRNVLRMKANIKHSQNRRAAMKKIINLFRAMRLIDKLFLGLGFSSFIVWLYLCGYFSGRIDDWSYNYINNFQTPDGITANFYLIFILPVFPLLVRSFFDAFRRAVSTPGLVINGVLAVIILFVLAAVSMPQFCSMSGDFGYSAGGAKDIDNFRQNIQRNYMPLETDITHEGLFYDYYFNTSGEAPAEISGLNEKPAFFKPVYSWVSSKDPLNGERENFITIGLRSDMDISKIKRKKLNLVVVLDISGSMSSRFNTYYYDRSANNYYNQFNKNKTPGTDDDQDRYLSKLAVACRSIVGLLDRLKPEDSFGMVLFDHCAYNAKPLRRMASTNINALKMHILGINTGGSTNMEAGYEMGRGLLEGSETLDPEEYENRIIFLTDAMPNTGFINSRDLLGLAKECAAKRIYSTFIGVGLDFNTGLIENITKVRGANYYSIHSSAEFKKRLDLEFDYMVNPLIFNLGLSFSSKRFGIAEVYGSPEADLATGELMKVNTLFPSPVSEGGVKGGIIVLKLFDTGEGEGGIKLTTTYETRSGAVETTSAEFSPALSAAESDAEKDARKAVLLARYVNLMKNWITNERGRKDDPLSRPKGPNGLSEWERSSKQLSISGQWRNRVTRFTDHFAAEAKLIGDAALDREQAILLSLAGCGR
jgi:Ca-activated chloride channel family protein